MFENMKLNDTIRGRLEHVVREFKKFSNVLDIDKYQENCVKIIRMTSCAICQILHGNMNNEISREDMIQLLRCFINSDRRINKLIVLTHDHSTCWYEPIKMAIQIESMEDINRCISSRDNDVCTVVNRAILVHRNKIFSEELFDLLKRDITNNEVKTSIKNLVTKIAVFLDPSIITTQEKENKPVIDNCQCHMHGPNFTCKDHVNSDVFPIPQAVKPPFAQPQPMFDPNTLPGRRSAGQIINNGFNMLNNINGSGQEVNISASNIANKFTSDPVTSWTPRDITKFANSNRELVRNRCIFPVGTSETIIERIIDKLSVNPGFKSFSKLMNETGYCNYEVNINDDSNFCMSGMDAEKQYISTLTCIGNNFSVNTQKVNNFENPSYYNVDPQTIEYYRGLASQ